MGTETALAVQGWSFAIFTLGVVAIAVLMLGLSHLLGGRSQGPAKQQPFESGIVSVGSEHMRFPTKFYLVAMFFVIFDLESVFLYAWSVSLREAGWPGFIEATTFVLILLGGLVYVWRLGGLDWAPASRRRMAATVHPSQLK